VDLQQAWPRPSAPRPIVIIGSGAIVQTAHLPSYRRLAFPIAGLFDVRHSTAAAAGSAFGVPVFESMAEACGVPNAVFDIAVPGSEVLTVIERLPTGSGVLIQKPMGEDLAMAARIRARCRERGLKAAINFQLRFSPNVLALHDLLQRGTLGDIVDVDVRLLTEQPWHLWSFLRGTPRLEVLYHSIHYLDTIRSILGDPEGVYCRAVGRRDMPDFSDTRSSIILDYGRYLRCSLALNHTYRAGHDGRASEIKVEGTEGVARLTMGVNLDYPTGPPDTLDLFTAGEWASVPLRGSWFPEAFEGPMSNLQRFVAGEDALLASGVDDAIRTMALVEACYSSSERGGTPVPAVD
jgi:predicted dehydrogenase